MGKGKDFELSVKNHVVERTNNQVDAYRPDFSGNSKYSVADVIIAYPTKARGYSNHETKITAAYIELKKRTVKKGNRTVVMSGSSSGGDETGMEELERLVSGTPPWATAYVGVKFPRRRIIVFDASTLYAQLDGEWVVDGFTEVVEMVEPRETRGGNISMVNPEGWEAGTDDEAATDILNFIGLDDKYRTDE